MQIYLQAPLPLLVFRRHDAEMLFEASAKKVVPTVHYYRSFHLFYHEFERFVEDLEKPSAFDPRGQSDVDPRKLFYFDPSKALTGGVIFILPCFTSWPSSYGYFRQRARCSVMSVRFGQARHRRQPGHRWHHTSFPQGAKEAMTIDFLSWRSSMISSRMGRSLASSGTRKASSRMSSRHCSIFFSSVSMVFLAFAT